MNRLFRPWQPLLMLLVLALPGVAQEKRFSAQLTFRDVKISTMASDVQDKYVSVGLADGRLMFFTIRSEKFRFFTPWTAHPSKAVTSIAFSPDDSVFATAGADGIVKLWSCEVAQKFAEETEKLQEKEARKVTPPPSRSMLKAHSPGPVFVTFSKDSKRLITGGADGTIKIWNVESASKPIATIEAHKGGVNCLT